jgi:hypothetical protein
MERGGGSWSSPLREPLSPFLILVELLFLLGLVARLRPLFLSDDELFRSFPTEDGYLMLTVARNIATGLGMSTAAGSIPTNGVQPLATFIQAAAFLVAGGDRGWGIRILIVVSTAVAAGAAWIIVKLGLRLMGTSPFARRASLLGAAAWFAAPGPLFTTMNMLESGIYCAAVAAVLLVLAESGDPGAGGIRWRWSLLTGALLGLAFWARNDAVILMAAAGLAHLLAGGGRAAIRVAETAVMGGLSTLVSLPWLLYNATVFGGVIPVSGQAYLGARDGGAALGWAAVAFFEHATLLANFEFNPIQHWKPFIYFCAAVAGMILARAAFVIARRAPWRDRPGAGRAILAAAIFIAGLFVFYTFFFDAPHFLRRYLFPTSAVLALLWGAAAAGLHRRLASGRMKALAPLLAVLLVANFASRDGLFIQGPWRRGVFFRSVDWIRSNVSEEAWLGAFQSGTLGFFHDRTINLDGKVNPAALEAIRHARLQAYVVESPIEYIVDWASLVEPWSRADAIVSRNFAWDVRDPEGNFAVLRRRPFSRPGNR